MHSTVNPKPTDDPHDVVVVPPDLVRVAPADEELVQMVQDLARRHSPSQTQPRSDVAAGPPVPAVDATFRASAADDVLAPQCQQPIRTLVRRTFAALLFAACTGAVALGWQSYGDVGKAMIVNWVPQLVTAPSLLLEKLGLSADSTPPAGEVAAANETPSQPATVGQAAQESVAANVVSSAESAPSLQSMARDLASVSQEVVQLKASIEQLKASQQQIARDAAKPPAQNAQAKIITFPPRLPVARPRKPVPTFAPTPAAATAPPPPTAAPYVPRQADPLPSVAAQPQIAPDGSSVPRPPMPVR
jgi:hypothetical protein